MASEARSEDSTRISKETVLVPEFSGFVPGFGRGSLDNGSRDRGGGPC